MFKSGDHTTMKHTNAAAQRQEMLSDAFIVDDQANSDFFLASIVFFVSAGAAFWGMAQFIPISGPAIIILSMVCGLGCAGLFVVRMQKRRAKRDRALRAQRAAIADAEMARKLKEMKRDRFEKGL